MDGGGFWRSIGLNRPVLALSVARMADAVGNSILFIMLPLYVAGLPSPGFDAPVPVLVGLLISLYGLASAVTQPLTGAWSDRAGRRKVFILAGLALIGLGTVGFIFATRFLDLLVLRAVQGVGVALTIPATMAIMTAVSEKATRGGSMGIYTTLRMTGYAMGPILGGILKVRLGFDAAFLAGAAFLLTAMILIQVWVTDTPLEKRPEGPRRFRVFDPKLLSPGLLSAGLATFLMANAFSLVAALENEFNARLGIDAFGFGIAFSALMVGRLLSQTPLGHWSDKIGRRPLVLAGLLFLAPVTALLGLVPALWQLVGLRVLQGVASACIAAPAFAIAGDLSRREGAGRQLSVVTMGFGLGIAVGPLLGGLLDTLSFELPFLAAGGMCLAGAWVVGRFMPETVERAARGPAPRA